MSSHLDNMPSQHACPKRIWLMTLLSDDEALPHGAALPQALRLHLAQCPSCRSLAYDIQHVTTELHTSSMSEPPESLFTSAERQLMEFVSHQALHNPTTILPEELLPDAMITNANSYRWIRLTAVAAVMLLAATVGLSFAYFNSNQPPLSTVVQLRDASDSPALSDETQQAHVTDTPGNAPNEPNSTNQIASQQLAERGRRAHVFTATNPYEAATTDVDCSFQRAMTIPDTRRSTFMSFFSPSFDTSRRNGSITDSDR